MPALGPERARQLVVAVGPRILAQLLERTAERVVRVVVSRRDLEHRAELLLRFLVTLDAEIRDPERLADRRLVRLPPLCLLQRHRRLRRPALPEVGPPLLIEVVGLAHVARR